MKHENLLQSVKDYLARNQKIINKSPVEFRMDLVLKAIEIFIQANNGDCNKNNLKGYYRLIEKNIQSLGYFYIDSNGINPQSKAKKKSNEKSNWDIAFEDKCYNNTITIYYKKPTFYLMEHFLLFTVWDSLEIIYEATSKLIMEQSKFRSGRPLPAKTREQYRKVIGLCKALKEIKSEEKFCEFVGINNYKTFNKWKNDHINDLTEELEDSFTEKELKELKQAYLKNL